MIIRKTNYILLFIFCYKSFFSQKDSKRHKVSISIEQEALFLPTLFLINNNKAQYKDNNKLFLLGGIKILINPTAKIKKSFFIDYQYYQYNLTYSQPSRYEPSLTYNSIASKKEQNLYFITGIDFRFTNKSKLSGFFTSVGLGFGKYKLKGDGFLYDSKTSWCNSIDFGYVFAFKHFYFKPFVGLLSIFSFKELINYNDGRIITDGNLNYYSQNNSDKSNLYQSSSSPSPSQIQIKYRYWGLTNTMFLPRGVFCLGFTF